MCQTLGVTLAALTTLRGELSKLPLAELKWKQIFLFLFLNLNEKLLNYNSNIKTQNAVKYSNSKISAVAYSDHILRCQSYCNCLLPCNIQSAFLCFLNCSTCSHMFPRFLCFRYFFLPLPTPIFNHIEVILTNYRTKSPNVCMCMLYGYMAIRL